MFKSRYWLHADGAWWSFAPIAGGVDVPTPAQAAEKYVRIASGRGGDYQQGITTTPAAEFEQAAIASSDAWQQGVTQAAAEGRFASGLQGSGARWRRKAEQVGVSRYGPGVTASRDEYSAGVQPYLQALGALTLDPRGPRGDPRNIQRVSQIAQALNQTRRGGAR